MTDHKCLRIAVKRLDAFERAIKKQWENFCESEGLDLTLDIKALDIPDLYGALFKSEGLKRGDFDVAFIVTDWIAEAVTGQHLIDLQLFLRDLPPDNYPNGWDNSLLHFQTYGDEVYGLPYHDGQKCLIYRKDLLNNPEEDAAYEKRYGYPLKVPQTWGEFKEVAQYFNRPENGFSGAVFIANQDGYNTICDFFLHFWSSGGVLYDRYGEFNLNQPLVEGTLSFYRDFVNDSSVMNSNTRMLDAVESGRVFAKGEAAMMINWFSCAAQCESLPESKVKGKVGVTYLPHDTSMRGITLNVYWVLGIASGCRNKDLAYRFIRHCVSKKMDRLLTLEGGNGSRLSTWQDEQLNQIIPYYRKLEKLQNNARDLPRHPKWIQLAAIIDDIMKGAINTNRPVANIVKDAQKRVEEI